MSDGLNCGNVNEIGPPKKVDMIVLVVDSRVLLLIPR